MNICDNEKVNTHIWISGHLYQWKDDPKIYIATDAKRLVDISTGHLYEEASSNLGKFGKDVTDQYCLQKVK